MSHCACRCETRQHDIAAAASLRSRFHADRQSSCIQLAQRTHPAGSKSSSPSYELLAMTELFQPSHHTSCWQKAYERPERSAFIISMSPYEITAFRNKAATDSAPGVATWEVTLSARKVVPCVRWPATGITAHSLQPSPRLRVRCASAGRRRRATLAYEQI